METIDLKNAGGCDDSKNAGGCDVSKNAVGCDLIKDIKEECEKTKMERHDAINPYGYLNRGDFSSEIYKIELANLPRRFGIAQLRKKLEFLGLSPCKIKCVDQGHYAFVTFRSEEDKAKAFEVLQGYVWKNKPIKVKNAAANADPLMLKRKQDAEIGDQPKMKVVRTDETVSDDNTPLSERLNNTVTPLWKMPYVEQLKMKTKVIVKIIKRLGRDIEKNNKDDKMWLSKQRGINDGLCCQLLPIKSSPTLAGYRNKCEFTVGLNPEGKDNTVGFRLGSYRGGNLSVLEPVECINIPDVMKQVAKDLQSFLQSRSSRSSFDPSCREGYWKQATVRTSRLGEVLLNVVMHPQTLSTTDLELEKDLLRQYYETLKEGNASCVTSLYFQAESDRKEKYEDGVCDHLLGGKYIQEELFDMKFRISPLSFFQVNTPAAEVLYRTIADQCKITSDTTLLDICCGTGTIGLTMAKRVKKVIGLELNSQAVEDARINAQINGIENAEFLCGKAEDLLPSLMRRVAGKDVVVVVDPPRAGLHSDVVRAIRKSSFVNRLIYVSCKMAAALQNIIDFTRQVSKRVSGKPFRLLEAVPVDLFPHTEHCEMILLLEREDQ